MRSPDDPVPSRRGRSSVVVALLGAVAAWLASLVATGALATRMELVTIRSLVVFALVSALLPGVLAVAVVGFWAGRRDRDAGSAGVVTAGLGAAGYLVASAVLVMLGGQLQLGAVSLAGGLGGACIGAGLAQLLLGRGSDRRPVSHW